MYKDFKEGNATQEDFDTATANLYGNVDDVVRYRHQLKNWNRPIEMESKYEVRGALKILAEDPVTKDNFNKVVRNAHLMRTPKGEPQDWTDDLTTAFSLFNDVANITDTTELWSAQRLESTSDFTNEELLRGVPEEYHSTVLQQAADYNDDAAMVFKDQLINDIENNRKFDNMPVHAQLGYGAIAMVVSPTTLLAAGPIVKGGQAVMATNKAWQVSRVIAGKGVVKGSNTTAKMAAWTLGGGVEGALINAPRLSGDHTYTARDYQLDVLMDAGFGLALGSVVEGMAKPALKYMKEVRASKAIERVKIQELIEKGDSNKDVEPPAPLTEESTIEETREALRYTWQNEGTKFAPLSDMTTVSDEGFKAAHSTLVDVFPQDTPLRKLMNSQMGLLNKNLSDEERVIAQKISGDILHLVSAFPDGNIPKAVGKAIEGITFTQKTFKQHSPLSTILEGKTSNPVGEIEGYVNSLIKRLDVDEAYVPQRVTSGQFYAAQSDWMSVGVDTVEPDSGLLASVPKELSYLRDIVELNKLALEKGDQRFIEVVEELNGMVLERLKQMDAGKAVDYVEPKDLLPKTVEMSPAEMFVQMKNEGLRPKTPEWKKRLSELRKTGRVELSPEVRQVGKINQQDVGVNTIEHDPDSVYDGGTDSIERTVDDKGVVEQVDNTANRPTGGKYQPLYTESEGGDVFPRTYSSSSTQRGYKNPTAETLTALRNRLNYDVLRKLGLKAVTKTVDTPAQARRLEAISKALIKDKATVIARMIKAGKWANVEDVIRVAHTLAANKRLLPKVEGEAPSAKPVTEDSLEVLADNNSGTVVSKIPDGEFEELKSTIEDVYETMVNNSNTKVSEGLEKFVASGEKEAFELANKTTGPLDFVGRLVSKITEDLGSKFHNSEIDSLQYVGTRITEIGRGFGGNIRRKATGGIIRDHAYKESIIQVAPQYVRLIDDYAVSKGKGSVGRMNAQQKAGADSELVDQFNREVFTVQELRRQGKDIPASVDKSVLDFVDQFDKYMDFNHSKLVDAGVAGFTKKRKVKNYIPHVWETHKLRAAIQTHGVDKIEELFTRAYQSSSANGVNPTDIDSARQLAKEQVEWIMTLDQQIGKDTIDQYSPVKDSRAKKRLDLDTTMEIDGLSILDLLDTEVIGLSVKYSNRMAGWIGLAESTDGVIKSQLDIDTLKQHVIQEGKDKGIKTDKYEQYYDDLMNLMFGRPTRGGLNQELRQIKDLTALTRMGGLGTAQLIETGQVITRSVLSMFSSEPTVKKVFSMAGESVQDVALIRDIQAISNVTNDIEWLDRQSVHLDQTELAKVNKARKLSLWLADKATFGALKAPASRLLGKTSGFNAIRRVQSRVTQASFVVDVAKHFKSGTGVMGNNRMADVGLTDGFGKDVELQDVFDNLVEYDVNGLPTKLNFNKWPESARKKFQYALLRDEAQQVQRTQVGELPPWMNKPMMALVFQFLQMPLVATNKQLGRSLAFADKEAVTAVMLNAAMSGLVRYSKFAALGAGVTAITGNEWTEPTGEQMQAHKYIAQFGIIPDARDLVLDTYSAGTNGDASDAVGEVLGKIPAMGLMSDYWNTTQGETRDNQIDAVQGIIPLGNVAVGDMLFAWLSEKFGD